MSNIGNPRVGVVGCGYWGRNLVRNFFELGALGAMCDIDQSSLDAMAKRCPVPICTNFEELLAMEDINAVVIAAPAAQHYNLSKQAILAGKDVFVEKPLALRVADGEELVRLAQKNSRVLMVGHILHYHPAVIELRRILLSGELGKIEYISSSRLNLGKLRTEEDILWSFAPHDISTILHLLGEMPETVAAQGASYLNHPISDVTLSVLSFASGVKAHIFVSWIHPYKEQKLIIVGNRQMAVFDDTEAERKLVLYPHRIDWVNRTPVVHKAEGQVVQIEAAEPLRSECSHFLECVRDRKTPNTDGGNGLQVLRVLHACGQSIEKHGQPLPLTTHRPRYFVHASAVVDEPCEIGDGTKIWHFSHVMAKSRIGQNCNLGQNVLVSPDVTIGNNVKIQNNVSLYTGVILEDDVFCGPSMVFTNVINPRSHVNRKNEYQRTLVKKGATLGANSTIVCGVNIGEYAFIAAGAVVTKDVPDHALMMGVPARQVGWMCFCGVRLEVSDGMGVCPDCGSSVTVDRGLFGAQKNSTSLASKETVSRSMAAASGND
ncbi:MAG TPA: Gfo/Idh/MocA family oxidoreductase [Candidatus Acidoferrum sp.]|nr:Gfo/Idh/MocA family oxidoreductase [Candidatus Acidoferrum sp.]